MVGDLIRDEYVYVTPLGMSAKESILAVRAERTESFEGGVIAAAKHVNSFCARVDVDHGRDEVVKKRFVEETYTRKLFEVHETKSGAIWQPHNFNSYDVVIVTDFGHGYVTKEKIKELSKARYLAVNAQTNSANRGFNLITKYPKADYVVIDELEARLAAQDRQSPIEQVIEKLGFPKLVVTRGAYGAVGYDGEFHKAEARTRKVVDTMGAGDAFFCITAPLAKAGADMQTLLEVGNAAGAIKCGVVGHRQSVTKEALVEYLS